MGIASERLRTTHHTKKNDMNGDSAEHRLQVKGLDDAIDQSEASSVDESGGVESEQLSLQDLPPRPKTPENTPEDVNSQDNEVGKIIEAVKLLGKQNEFLKNELDATNLKTNNTNMGMITLIDVLKKLNLKLEAETDMRLQLEEKVDRQQQIIEDLSRLLLKMHQAKKQMNVEN